MFSDCLSSSPWLSSHVSQVSVHFLDTKAFPTTCRWEESHPLYHTQKCTVCSNNQSLEGGEHWKSTERCQLPSLLPFTFTFESLFDQPPEQAATVVTEGGAHVVVNFEAMRHVNVETFLLKLRTGRGLRRFALNRTSFTQKMAGTAQSSNNFTLTTPRVNIPHLAGKEFAHETPPTPWQGF